MKHWLMLGLGWGLILLGIAGLFLPILQGILFLAIGVVVLSRRSPWVRWLLLLAGRRWPRLRRALAAAKRRIAALRRRFGFGRARGR